MISKNKAWHPVLHPLQIVILLTLLQILIALLSNYLTFDEAIWEYIGRNWFRNGLNPYSGGVDNKSPLIYAIFGVSDKIFGVNYWFPRALGIFCQSIGLYFVYKIAKHIADQKAGVFAITLYGLSLLWKSTDGAYPSLTETYAVTFIIISFYRCITALDGKDFFIAGIIAALGFAFRLTACFGILAIFILSLRKNLTSAVAFSIGILLSVIVVATFMSLAGVNLYDFLTYGFIDNFGPGSPTDYNISWRLQRFIDSFFYSELILFYPFVTGYFIIKKKIDSITLWLICEFIGINIVGLYARAHLKELLPALSLTSGICLSHLTRTYKVPPKPIILIIWITFFPKILEPFVSLKKLINPVSESPDKYCQQPLQQIDNYSEKELGLWIKSNTREQEKVYVAGYGVRVQAYSERQSPTIYFNVTQTKLAKERLFHDLATINPDMIAVPQFQKYSEYVNEDIRSFVDELVAKRYFFDRCLYGYSIYRLKK